MALGAEADRGGQWWTGQPEKNWSGWWRGWRQSRRWEPAWHRRCRAKRSEARLATRLAAHCVRLCEHHGSQLPKELRAWKQQTEPSKTRASTAVSEVLHLFGLSGTDGEAEIGMGASERACPGVEEATPTAATADHQSAAAGPAAELHVLQNELAATFSNFWKHLTLTENEADEVKQILNSYVGKVKGRMQQLGQTATAHREVVEEEEEAVEEDPNKASM